MQQGTTTERKKEVPPSPATTSVRGSTRSEISPELSFLPAKHSHSNLGLVIKTLQVSADAITVFACFMASYSFYVDILKGWSPQTFLQFASIAAMAAILYVIILDRVGMYRREQSLMNIIELRGIFHTGIYAAAIILSLSFYIRIFSLSRIMFTTALVATPIALYLERKVFYWLHLRLHRKGWSENRIFIYGAGNIGTQLAKRIFQSPSLGFLPVGFLDDDVSRYGSSVTWMTGPRAGLKVLGGEDVLKHAREFGVKKVFIALPSATFDRNQKLVELCVQEGLDYAIVPNAYEQFIQQVEMVEIGGLPLLRRRQRPAGGIYLVAKRVLDFSLSAFFIAALSPLVLIIGFLIKAGSSGPIIFKQKRVGFRGKEFSCYKFRSMFVDAPKYARTPSDPADPRITKIGRWIRRTSLDELPQLFNVLRGDMSIVGPRPEMPFIVAAYSPLERRRLDAKPGITGVWQISAVRGEPIHANIEYDLFYIENRSLLLDLAIIVKTIVSVVRGIGAI